MNFLDFIKVILMTSFGLSISLCLVPVLFPIFAVFSIITGFVTILVKLRYGNTAFKANGTDVLSGKESEDSYPIINVAFRFTGQMEPKLFRERILDVATNSYDKYGNRRYERLMLLYKRRFGYYIWQKNNNFDIDQHIKVITDDDLGSYKKNKESGDNTWESLIKAILNKFGGERVQQGIPQWQLLLYKEDSERYTALFRFHHSIADGIYVSRMLVEEFLDSPTKLFHSYVPPTAFAKIILKLWSFCLLPFGLWKILKNNDKNVLHGFKLTGEKKYFVSKSISMDLLRDLRLETGMSIHAILFSCLSACISGHFKRRNTDTKEITTLIPIPMQDLSKPIELKNRYAVVSLKIPTSPSPSAGDRKSFPGADLPSLSPLNRLDSINATLLEAKKDPTFIAVHSLITTFCSFLPAKVAESLLSTKGCSVAFSNLPGPQETIHFKKDKIEEVMFWIPDRSPMGLGLSILSYDNHIRAGLSMDSALLRDDEEGELLIKDFENEVGNISNSLRTERELLYSLKQENEKLLSNLP